MKAFLAALAMLLTAAAAGAGEVEAGALRIGHAFALETAPSAMAGAGYLTVTNRGDVPDRLIEVRADFARVMMHDNEITDGVARMVHLDAIEIAPGATVTLEPGGKHIMFMGLDGDPLQAGETIPATLVFERAGEVPVTFVVEARGSGAAPQAGH